MEKIMIFVAPVLRSGCSCNSSFLFFRKRLKCGKLHKKSTANASAKPIMKNIKLFMLLFLYLLLCFFRLCLYQSKVVCAHTLFVNFQNIFMRNVNLSIGQLVVLDVLVILCKYINDDIVNIGLHFFLKNVRPYAASCSEA